MDIVCLRTTSVLTYQTAQVGNQIVPISLFQGSSPGLGAPCPSALWLHSCSTHFRSDTIGESEPVPGCSFNSFCLLFICLFVCLFVCLFFVKVSRPEGRIRTESRFTPTVFIYLIKTFYLCHFVLGFSITWKHFQMVGP